MNPRKTTIWLFAFAFLVTAGVARAQATRTWVSGVGDDVNPCSRTAPCKTFAGAISKTAAGGEINVLDPGGFGAVTVTKSITISSEGFEAGVLVNGTNGIIVSAAASDVVILRGLDIEGLGTGLDGIKVLNAGAVFVEKCVINHFAQYGIELVPSLFGTSGLYVSDTVIRNCAGGGIEYHPTSPAAAIGTVDRCRLERNGIGLRVYDGSKVVANQTVATGNSLPGFIVMGPSSASEMTLESCVANANGTNGVKADGTFAIARLSNLTTTNNASFGITAANGAAIQSFGNNRNFGNGTNGGPTVTEPLQ